MLKGNSLLDHTYLLSFNEYENNDNLIISISNDSKLTGSI